jgi:hypothetical protein
MTGTGAGAAVPGQAGAPELFSRWFRIVYPHASQQTINETWGGHLDAEREFWTEIDAAQAAIAAAEPAAPRGVAAQLEASDRIVRDILESLCRRDGLSLESTVVPGDPARNYALAERLGIGHVFGLPDTGPAAPQSARSDVLGKRFFHLASELENEAPESDGSAVAQTTRAIARRIRKGLDE